MKNRKLSTPWELDYWMASNGFYCGFNTPKSKTNDNDKSLPEYAWQKAFLRDEYPACPKKWMSSEGTIASYFVGVSKNNGMWLDFNRNSKHSHDVAVVVSIQGINPITGLPCHDPNLEQYLESCPKCNKKFGANRYCESCGYKWPKQNYIATTAQPDGQLWIDGFRTVDGIVRQYIFTDDIVKGVASNIIGKDRVFAVGVSFFISKDKKKKTPVSYGKPNIMSSSQITISGFLYHDNNGFMNNSYRDKSDNDYLYMCGGTTTSLGMNSSFENNNIITRTNFSCDHNNPNLFYTNKTKNIQEIQTSKIEVGAGTTINQQIYDDPENLDYWREIPEAMIVVNYALEDEVLKIICAGRKEKTIKENGFLDGIPVGNK